MAANLDLRYIAAPMVNQSDTPFRALVHQHGGTLTYTEMLKPARLLSDPDYLAFHRRALESGRISTGPVVVQLCGNDQDEMVRGAKTVVDLCDGIGNVPSPFAALTGIHTHPSGGSNVYFFFRAKVCRSKPRMSSGYCQRGTFRSILAQKERLASRSRHR
jgi:Dihydrouridine synthase (Dus)